MTDVARETIFLKEALKLLKALSLGDIPTDRGTFAEMY